MSNIIYGLFNFGKEIIMSTSPLTAKQKQSIIFEIITMDTPSVKTAEIDSANITDKFETERQRLFQKTGNMPPISSTQEKASLTRLVANEVRHARQDGTDVDLYKLVGVYPHQHALS